MTTRLSFSFLAACCAILSSASVASGDSNAVAIARSLEDTGDEDFDCSDLPEVLAEGSLEDKLPDASEYFRNEFDADDFVSNFIFADGGDIPREEQCKQIANGPAYNIMSCLARDAGTTIGLDFGTDLAVLGFKVEYVVSLLWGENGQFACAYNQGLGGALDLVGVGSSFGVSVRSTVSDDDDAGGGWGTVATGKGRLCLTAGYTVLVGLAATLVVDPTKIGIIEAIETMQGALSVENWGNMNQTEAFQTILGDLFNLTEVDGVTSVGVEANAALEILDMTVVGTLIPDVAVTFCSERLAYCVGEGCDEKIMA